MKNKIKTIVGDKAVTVTGKVLVMDEKQNAVMIADETGENLTPVKDYTEPDDKPFVMIPNF